MIQVMIVDDEPIAQDVIKKFVEQIPDFKLVTVCDNAIEAYNMLKTHKIDLVFLDIEMPELNGMSLIKILKNPPEIIITTAYPNYAVEGFELDVTDYLLKPVSFARFLKAIEKLGKRDFVNIVSEKVQSSDENFVFVKSNNEFIKIEIKKILYIEALENYISIFTNDRKLIALTNLKKISTTLPDTFIRVHRSYLVNFAHINSFYGNILKIGNKEIPIGRSYRDEVLKLLKEKSL